MTIRIIVKNQYTGLAEHFGGDLEVHYKTFEIENAELEGFLTEPAPHGCKMVVGAEVIQPKGLDNG